MRSVRSPRGVPRRGNDYSYQNYCDFDEIKKQKIPVQRRQAGSEGRHNGKESSGKDGSEKSRDLSLQNDS